MKDTVTAYDIKKALAKRHGDREFFITECKNGATATGMLQFDAVAIYKSWAHPQIRGYEVKISRSDFLRDIKYTQYLPYCHEFYFVTPAGMVQRQEVEENIGLIWYNPKTGTLTTKKKAVHRKIEVSSNMLLYIIMNRLDSDRLPFTNDKAEYWREWVEGKKSNRELGYQVNCKLLEQVQELQRENERYRRFKEEREEYGKIMEVMQAHGIKVWRDAPGALDKALTREYPAELDVIQRRMQEAIDEINKLKQKEERPNDEQK